MTDAEQATLMGGATDEPPCGDKCRPTCDKKGYFGPVAIMSWLNQLGVMMTIVFAGIAMTTNKMFTTANWATYSWIMLVLYGVMMVLTVVFVAVRWPYAGDEVPTMRRLLGPLTYSIMTTVAQATFVWIVYTFRNQYTPTDLSSFDTFETSIILTIPDGTGATMLRQYDGFIEWMSIWSAVLFIMGFIIFHGAAFKNGGKSFAMPETNGARNRLAARV